MVEYRVESDFDRSVVAGVDECDEVVFRPEAAIDAEGVDHVVAVAL